MSTAIDIQACTARADAVLREAEQDWSLESLLCDADGFGLVTATPTQRAICRVADGLPLRELAQDPDVMAALGGTEPPQTQPAELYLLSGIRTGKSLLAAALAVRATQTCDLSKLGHGETARVSVLSLKLDLAKVIYDHILGNVQASPRLRGLLIGEPTSDTIVLRQSSSGRPVEIKVVAGSRAGSSVVARWSAGCIFDEAPRMVGADDGVVNMDDTRRAVLGRLLPGAQLVAIGSPWAPFGPVYEAVEQRWGQPTSDLVVVRAKGQTMHPQFWTDQRCAELKSRDPIAYKTDVLCEFVSAETSQFSADLLASVTRAGPEDIQPEPGYSYVAAIDPATRGNAWTLSVGTRLSETHWAVCLTRQWQGSSLDPLSPLEVFAEIAELLRPYRVCTVHSDQWSADALQDSARQSGLHLQSEPRTTAGNVDMFDCLHTLAKNGHIDLPPNKALQSDLRRVVRKVTQTGVRIELPRTGDGRHCDYAPTVARLVTLPCALPTLPDFLDKRAHWGDEERRMFEDAKRRGRRRNDYGGLSVNDHSERPFYQEAS